MKSLITFLFVCLFSGAVHAQSIFHPSRPRTLVHSSYKFGEGLDVDTHVVIPNMRVGILPNVYLVLDWKTISWLKVLPCLGLSLQADQPIASVRLHPEYKKFWGWVDFEFRPWSWGGYWFAQIQYQPTKFVGFGLENESWGNFHQFSEFSHGGGPNVLLRFSQNFRMDIIVHARKIGGESGLEPYFRFHVFF